MRTGEQWHHGYLSPQGAKICARYAVIPRYDPGGVSCPPFASLNVGLYVGDSRDIVVQNRRYVQSQLGLQSLCFARQRHGVNILEITPESSADCSYDLGEEEGCDALLTTIPAMGLAVQHADCQAVLLYDLRHVAIAAVHCGWRGSVQNILGVTLAKMAAEYRTNPAEVTAFIGPSLGSCCAEFINYKKELPDSFFPYMVSPNHFDFHAISTMQLVAAGLRRENITSLTHCTSCSSAYFSYRRSRRQGQKDTGRNCTIVWLEEVKR